jgi:hypothetical protein
VPENTVRLDRLDVRIDVRRDSHSWSLSLSFLHLWDIIRTHPVSLKDSETFDKREASKNRVG